MRLSDAGLRQRKTKLLYPNHRLPPWFTEDAPRDRSNRLLDDCATNNYCVFPKVPQPSQFAPSGPSNALSSAWTETTPSYVASMDLPQYTLQDLLSSSNEMSGSNPSGATSSATRIATDWSGASTEKSITMGRDMSAPASPTLRRASPSESAGQTSLMSSNDEVERRGVAPTP